jgi:hypothetical protein
MNTLADETAEEAARRGDVEAAAGEATALCGGDARAAVMALIVANDFLERELELAHVAVSSGYSRQWHAKGRASPGSR